MIYTGQCTFTNGFMSPHTVIVAIQIVSEEFTYLNHIGTNILQSPYCGKNNNHMYLQSVLPNDATIYVMNYLYVYVVNCLST